MKDKTDFLTVVSSLYDDKLKWLTRERILSYARSYYSGKNGFGDGDYSSK